MKNIAVASALAILLTACQTYIPIAVHCEPPVDISSPCQDPVQSYAITAINSNDQNIRENALTESIADLKSKFDRCSAKQAALSELLASCNKIVDRTVDAVKRIK